MPPEFNWRGQPIGSMGRDGHVPLLCWICSSCKCTNYFVSSDPHHGIQFIPSDILSCKSSGILFGIIFEILSGILSGISSGILSGISIWHSIWHVFWHSIWHIFWQSICHIFWHSIWHIYLAFSLAFYIALFLAVEVRLRSGEAHSIGGWGPARPTALRISAVEVRRGPQRSDSRRLTGRWGLARITAIELADEIRRGPLRSRAEEEKEGRKGRREKGGRKERRSRASDIRSNNPHLAGGEKWGREGWRDGITLT